MDPADTGHAWITLLRVQLRHAHHSRPRLRRARERHDDAGSGTFTNLNVESSGTSNFPTPFSDGDLPVSDVVRDDANQTLYVSTDFGVLVGNERRTVRLARH